MTHYADEQRATIARAHARPDLLLKGPENGWYLLVNADTSEPVIGLEQDEFRVTLDQVEAHLGI